jgi:hypothetical protein
LETALYFPFVHVPENPWFTQVLLYWDQAAVIVPDELLYRPDFLPPYMADLEDKKLLKFVKPEEVLWRHFDDFMTAFFELLGPWTGASLPPNAQFVEVHSGKLSYQLFAELRGRGLAREPGAGDIASKSLWSLDRYGDWWEVESTTADLYMAYVASVISAIFVDMTPDSNWLPVTDRPESMATLSYRGGDFDQRLRNLRYAVITKALPTPRGPVAPRELREFKKKHAGKLIRCRRYLDDKLASLAALDDPAHRKTTAEWIMQEIGDDLAALEESMRKKKWPEVTMAGIGGVVGSALATAAGAVGGGSALAVGLGVGAGIFQAGAAAQTAMRLMKMQRYDARSPLAYAALVGRL